MLLPEYFDIHSHLNFSEYDVDREEVIKNLKSERIATITVGTNLKTSREALQLAQQHDNIFASIGLHPIDEEEYFFNEQYFETLVKDTNVVAIGECGLDYSRLLHQTGVTDGDNNSHKKKQKDLFEQQIAFAVKHAKPLMIHCRDAYPDILALLQSKKSEYGERLKGNFHFFTSTKEIAKQCLNLDFTVSFTGPITFATQYSEVVEYVPLDKMMTETDSPFATPFPYRGKRNNPLYVKHIVSKIANIKKIDPMLAKEQLVHTSLYFFLKDTLSGIR